MQAFQRDIDSFVKLNAQVLGISTDNMATHKRFSQEYGLSFPLIADVGSLKEQYGKDRITYIIDRFGIIRFIQSGMPDNERILQEIQLLEKN
jgi:peroxiredoxin Q/BCP